MTVKLGCERVCQPAEGMLQEILRRGSERASDRVGGAVAAGDRAGAPTRLRRSAIRRFVTAAGCAGGRSWDFGGVSVRHSERTR